MSNNNINVAVAYCRVSTDEQANKGLSMDVQEEACVEAIKADGYKLLKTIRDEGKSAGSLNRPGIEEVIRLVAAGEVGAVYAISGDRISRNTMDYLYFRDLLRKNNVELRYVYQQIGDDSAISRTMDTVMASFNEMQRLVVSEKVKKTLYAKAKAGYFPTTAPMGYRNVTNPDLSAIRLAKKIIVPDSDMAPLVAEAFKLYATGNFNGYDLNELMQTKGLRTRLGLKLSPSRFYELLKNRIYMGELHWGEIHLERGQHKPLIDKETFERVQSIMAGHNNHACRRRKYSWLLNGFVYCAQHQKRYTAEWHLSKKLAYYHCSNRHGCGRYIETNKLEAMVADKFRDLEFDEEFIELVIDKVKSIFYNRRREYESRKQALINQRAAFEAKLRVAEEKLLSRVMPDDEFTRIRNEVESEVNNIEEKIVDLENKHNVKVDVAQEILRFTENIYDAYMRAPNSLKRHYLAFFWERFEVADGIIIRSVPSLLFRELLKLQQAFVKTANTENTSDSNIESEVILRPNLLRGQGSNLQPTP